MDREQLQREMGERIRRQRERQGLRQKEFASSISGCSIAYISQIENGKKLISLNRLHEVCEALNVSSDYLMCRIEKPIAYKRHKNADISVQLGLDDGAIEQLEGIAYDEARQTAADAINYLLESGIPSGLFDQIGKFMRQPANARDEQASIIYQTLFKLLDGHGKGNG